MTHLLLILIIACEVPHASEALVQSARQAAADPAAAARACQRLAPKSAGECLALLAGQVAPDDLAAAETICTDVSDALWRDECWFLVAEAAAASAGPAAAVETCVRAGRFSRNCLAHLWLDAASRAHGDHPGDPAAAWQQYQPTTAWVPSGAEAEALARRHQSTFFDARFNPTGDGGEPPPVDAGWCAGFDGTLARACRQAASETLQRQLNRAASQGVDPHRLCGAGSLAERIADATGVRWVPDEALDRRAASLIARTCAGVTPSGPPR